MRQFVLITVLLAALPAAAQEEISFANSGAPAAQQEFTRGLAQLHNFEYWDAAEHFRAAQKIDPSFAMAYWGEAMTYTHPIWFQQDLPAARAALERFGKTPEDRAAKAKTERERDYLRTLDVLYGEGSKNDRDVKYAEAMGRLHAKYPDDVDATAFYALALLGTAHEGRDFATYMRAAALLEEVFPTHRKHPGVLHYLIHSYDDPVHAPLGMRAARLYGSVAPKAGHALHMTSHIFIAMGMWDDVVNANLRAIDVVNQQAKTPVDCGHYVTWLHYGYLQQKKVDEARKTLEKCRAYAFAEPFVANTPAETQPRRVSEYADMLAAFAASGQPLNDADVVTVSAPNAAFTVAYAALLDSARRGDAKAVDARVARLRELAKNVTPAPGRENRTNVILQEADALSLIAHGKRDEAIALLQKTLELEHALPFEFGPPDVAKPAAELLAEQFLAAGRKSDAEAAYRKVQERAPGRAAAVHVH